MPAKFDLTWDGTNKRWRIQFEGKRYVVSCRQLGVPPTKEGSYRVANEWWDKKSEELRGQPKELPHPHQPILAHLDQRIEWAKRNKLEEVVERSEAAKYMVLSADKMTTEDIVPFVEENTGGSIATWSEVIGQSPVPEKTLGALAQRYFKGFELRRKAGDLSSAEYALLRRCVSIFVDWIGGTTDPQQITPQRWEDYYHHLLERTTTEKKFGNLYASKCFKYARRFVRWLASMDLIAEPRNLSSTAHRFDTRPGKIETFTIDEAKTLIEAAPGQLKLHLILMLNCGFTQSDLSALLKSEVNLGEGTITRQRSKTRKRHGQNVPTVTWRLWSLTLDLFRRYASSHETLALTTQAGRPLVERGFDDGKDKATTRDSVASNYRHVVKRINIKKPLKLFRKTASTALDAHPEHSRYAQFFLGQAPDSIAASHYVEPDQEQFDRAVAWLGERFGFVTLPQN